MHRLARLPQRCQIAHRGPVDLEIGLAHSRGLVGGKAHIFQYIATSADRAVKGFAHDVIGTSLIQLIDMHPVARARHDMQIGAHSPGIGDDARRTFRIVHRDDQN